MAALPAAAGAQGAIIDHRTSVPPSLHLTVSEQCTVFGTPDSGLADGLLEVYSATRLANGNVAVMDAKAKAMYLFASDGKFIRQIGRRGNGPGEFSAIMPTVFPYRGDSLLVHQSQSHIIQIFTSAGVFARSYRTEHEPGWGFHTPVGTLSDGSLLWSQRPRGPMPDIAVERQRATFVWRDPLGNARTTLPTFDDVMIARKSTRTPMPSPRGDGTAFRVSLQPVAPGPITRTTEFGTSSNAHAARGAWTYRFDEANDALLVFGLDGQLKTTIRVKPLEARLRPAPDRVRPMSEAQILELRADELGRAWLEMPRADPTGSRQWLIFDSTGRWVGRATTPPYSQVLLEVRSDYVLLRRLDADDVQTVAGCGVTAVSSY